MHTTRGKVFGKLEHMNGSTAKLRNAKKKKKNHTLIRGKPKKRKGEALKIPIPRKPMRLRRSKQKTDNYWSIKTKE